MRGCQKSSANNTRLRRGGNAPKGTTSRLGIRGTSHTVDTMADGDMIAKLTTAVRKGTDQATAVEIEVANEIALVTVITIVENLTIVKETDGRITTRTRPADQIPHRDADLHRQPRHQHRRTRSPCRHHPLQLRLPVWRPPLPIPRI
jgi:hypothetical protein